MLLEKIGKKHTFHARKEIRMAKKRKVYRSFDQDVDSWFDKLSGKRTKGPNLWYICRESYFGWGKKSNIQTIKKKLKGVTEKKIKRALTKSVNGVINNKYKKEIRRQYSGKKGEVSQASELIGLIDQACRYSN